MTSAGGEGRLRRVNTGRAMAAQSMAAPSAAAASVMMPTMRASAGHDATQRDNRITSSGRGCLRAKVVPDPARDICAARRRRYRGGVDAVTEKWWQKEEGSGRPSA